MLSRRELIANITAAGVCGCVLGSSGCKEERGDTPTVPGGAFSSNGQELRIDLEKVPQLAKVGGAAKLTGDANLPRLIIARASESSYLVMSIRCPHQGAEVEYNHGDQTFECVSHPGVFAIDGKRKSGPPRKDLPAYAARVEGTTLVVDLPA